MVNVFSLVTVGHSRKTQKAWDHNQDEWVGGGGGGGLGTGLL